MSLWIIRISKCWIKTNNRFALKDCILHFERNNKLLLNKRKTKDYINWTEERKAKKSQEIQEVKKAKIGYTLMETLVVKKKK